MSKMKIAAFLLLASGYVLALGWNCIPNIGGAIQLPA
jgi:hypothetical protein